MPGADGGNRRLHRRGIAQRGVAVARGESGGHRPTAAGPGIGGAGVGIVAVIFGLEFTGQVDFRSGDMTVDVHAAGHDHHAPGVYGFRAGRDVIDNFAVFNTNVADRSVDAVNRVVNFTVDDPHGRSHSLGPGLLLFFIYGCGRSSGWQGCGDPGLGAGPVRTLGQDQFMYTFAYRFQNFLVAGERRFKCLS